MKGAPKQEFLRAMLADFHVNLLQASESAEVGYALVVIKFVHENFKLLKIT